MSKEQQDQAPPDAYYDSSTPAVVVQNLAVTDPTVVSESRRWSTGQRGAAVNADEMSGADLSAFVTQAMVVGAHAIGSAGGVQDTFNLEQLVTDVGTRTAESTVKATDATSAVVEHATETVQKAAVDAQRVIAEAGNEARTSFAANVTSAKKSLLEEVQRLVGGDNPELLARLSPMLEKFGHDLDDRVAKQTSELFTKAARQFDPDDPTSPMSKHARALAAHQESLSVTLEKNHKELAAKVDELATAVKVTTSANDAATATASVTPLKGNTYEAGINLVMAEIAAGLGDEYVDTSDTTGIVARSKKGDGVLSINGGSVRVVLEMTDSKRSQWNDYLDEAERNRGATASLGLVRDPAQNNGNTIRTVGARRIILAFDPGIDDTDLLRTVVQLLRIAAVAATSRHDREEIQTADEKIREALAMLTKIDDIKKSAGTIRSNADKIERESNVAQVVLARLLTEAQTALSAAAEESTNEAA
ncbi:MAG: Fis family transcriptional regulator [Acidimicrobiales bacterium]